MTAGAALRRLETSLRVPASVPGVLAACALVAFALLAVACAWRYLASPAYPFGAYADLGTNLVATANIDAAIRSPRDLVDSIGWNPWDNGPAFAFNPMGSYWFLVPFAKLAAHDAVLAVKVAQVLQFAIAWAGAAALYLAIAGRRMVYACAAGLAYALVPQTALQIRGNVDFGFVTAFTPVALALAIALVDRAGARALPLAGVLCGASSLCFAIEYFFLTSLGAYAICAARTYRRSAAWAAFALLGLGAAAATGSFVILASFAARRVYRDPVARIAELFDVNVTRLFSEAFGLAGALVPRENAISPTPELNVSSSLALLAPAAVVFALAGLSFAAGAGNLRRYRLRGAFAVLVVSWYLSLGPNVLFGDAVWRAIASAPGVQLLRTPDRFIALPSLLVPLFAMLGLAGWSDRLRALGAHAARVALVVVAASAFAATFAFDAREHVFGLDLALPQREPGLAAVNGIARGLGGRVVPLAFVDGTSSLDSPSYGAGLPFERFGWDVAERFAFDGLGASGIFSRAGVHTVIASPNWTNDAPWIPDLAQVFAGAGGMHRAASEGGVSLFALDRRVPDIARVRTGCFAGDVGLFDRLLAAPALDGVALRTDAGARCDARVLAGGEEATAPRAMLGVWPGAAFADATTALRDADYPFVIGRNLLAAAWYRDAIDGDRTWFDVPAARIGAGFAARLPGLGRRGASAELLVRLANHCPLTASVTAGNRRVAFALPARIGLHWITVPLGALAASTPVTFAISGAGADAFPSAPWHGAALDALGLAGDPAAVPRDAGGVPAYVAFDPARLASRGESRVWIPAGTYVPRAYAANGTGKPRPGLRVDGLPVFGSVRFAAAGAHTVALAGRGAGLVVLVPSPLPPAPRPASFARRSAASWTVVVSRPQTLEAAVVNDGSWQLVPSASSAVSCDLVNTCFPNVPKGNYVLCHRLPPGIALGLSISALVALAAGVLALPGGAFVRRIRARAAPRRAAAP